MVDAFLLRMKNKDLSTNVIDRLISKSLEKIIEVITTMLTNNLSEWIDSDTAGLLRRGMKYLQFLDLEPDIIRKITLHLQELYNKLDIGPAQNEICCSPGMTCNHCEPLLEMLRAAVEVTESLLMINM
jgi:hypothetical protein